MECIVAPACIIQRALYNIMHCGVLFTVITPPLLCNAMNRLFSVLNIFMTCAKYAAMIKTYHFQYWSKVAKKYILLKLKKAVRLNANLTISNRVVDHCRALYRNRVSSWQSHCYVVLFLFDYDVISNVNNCESE